MKFMLLLSMKGGIPVEAGRRAEIGEKMGKWMAELEERGKLVSSYPLYSAQEASVFRKSGERIDPWNPSAEEDVVVASILLKVESTEEVNMIVKR